MKKILCPTDFSEASHNAIAYAAKLAQATHAQVTLLNVQSLFDLTAAEIIRGKTMTIQAVGELLESQSREVSKVFKISCYSEVEPTLAPLSKVITTKATTYDLVVMGTDGPNNLYKFFAGSNTYNAIKRSNIPLLMIPNHCGYSDIDYIVYAYNYFLTMKLPMGQLMPWVRALDSSLTILEVMEEAHSKYADEELGEIQKVLRTMYSDADLDFDTVYSNDVPTTINSYMLRNKADMLALCTVHRNKFDELFHNSIIKSINSLATYPVFVFHE